MNEIDFTPPFEVGEYVDIKLRVYLPKDAKEQGEHFGPANKVALGVAYTMNRYYARFQELSYWSSCRIWFAPRDILEEDVQESWLSD